MTMFLGFDKKASKQAALLAFAVTVHTVVLWDQDIHSSLISSIVYCWYDELIITSALLQLWVSRDGMAKGLDNAFRLLQDMLFRFVFHSYRIYKSSSTSKKIKGRT